MKKRKVAAFFVVLLLIIMAFLTGTWVQQEREEAKRSSVAGQQANKECSQGQMEALVRLMPGTTQDMLSADYWTGGTAGELMFSAAEIKEYGENNPISIQYNDKYEGRKLRLFMYDLPDVIEGYVIEELFDLTYLESAMDGKITPYVNGELREKEYWSAIRENCALESIPAKVTPQYCICVKRDTAKTYPSEDFTSTNPSEIYCSDFVSAEVMPLSGVVAVHESKDHKWVYVINGSYCGWVKKDELAYCKDREQWLSFCKPEEFLMVTGCEIVLDETATQTKSAGMMLPMGTKIKLLRESEELIGGRQGIGCFVAEIPVREEDGSLGVEKVLIPVSKDVSVGYLTMTSDAVLDQAFKFLGKLYGWGGSFSSNDCSGFVRQVYACFGFELPRNSGAIASLYDLGGENVWTATPQRKREIMKKMPKGALLYMDGHLMIFLGMVGDEPYVISSCATYIEPGDASKTIQGAYGVFVSNLELLRKDGNTWLESINIIQWKDY